MKPAADPQPKRSHSTEATGRRDPLRAFLEAPEIREARLNAQSLGDRAYCDLLVDFANEGMLSEAKWISLMGGARRAPRGRITGGLTELVREQLSQYVRFRGTASKKLGPFWAVQFAESGAASLPTVWLGKDSVEIRHHVLALDPMAALAYAMWLVMDERLGIGRRLWQCRLSSCGRFFFETPHKGRGRPRREYCSDEHLDEGHRENTRVRVAKLRADRKRRGLTRGGSKPA